MSISLEEQFKTLDASPEFEEEMRQAYALYENRLKALLEPEQNGKTVAIHAASGDYIVAETSGDAMRAMYGRHPEGPVLLQQIGPATDSGLALRMQGKRILSLKMPVSHASNLHV